MEQFVDSCVGPAGEEIAFASVGSGPPLVLAAWWTSHLELDWQNDEMRAFLSTLAKSRRVVRYDRPGVGMSSRSERTFDLAAESRHLEAVVAAVDGPVDLLGISCGGPPCIDLAARRPDLVRRMAFFGSYLHGGAISDAKTQGALRDLVAANWGLGSRTLTSIFLPNADGLTARRFASAQRHTATAEMAAQLLDLTFAMDVGPLASKVACPSLVLHRRDDHVIELAHGEELAATLPDATFLELEGGAHLPWAEAGVELAATISGFLDDRPPETPGRRQAAALVVCRLPSASAGPGSEHREEFERLRRAAVEEAHLRHGAAAVDGAHVVMWFDLVGPAVSAAVALRDRCDRNGMEVALGVHAGEVEMGSERPVGTAVVAATVLCQAAAEGVVRCSTTAREIGGEDLVGHPGIEIVGAPPPSSSVVAAPGFERSADGWRIAFNGSVTEMRHSKGLADLATLVGSAGHHVDAVVLMDGEGAGPRFTGDDMLDSSAIAAYRRRLGELDREMDRADALGDVERSAAADLERGQIIEQLRAAEGLGGRVRRVGDDVERARKAVSGRLRDAITRLAERDPALGAHLAERISTGRTCVYR